MRRYAEDSSPLGQSETEPRLQGSEISREEALVTGIGGGGGDIPFPVRSAEDTSQEVLLGWEASEPGAWPVGAMVGRRRRR